MRASILIWLIGFQFTVGVMHTPGEATSLVDTVLILVGWPIVLGNVTGMALK